MVGCRVSGLDVGLASGSDAADCHRLAYEVFYEEMGAFAEVADHDRRELCDDVIRSAELLCAKVDGRVVGGLGLLYGDAGFPHEFESGFDIERYASVVPRKKMAVSIRFLVAEEHRSTAVPYALMVEAGRRQLERGIELCFADCQVHLLNLYQALGFRPCAAPLDQMGFGMMVPLLLVGGDVDHMRSVGSPMVDELDLSHGPADLVERVVGLLPQQGVPGPAGAAGVVREELWAAAYEVLSRPDRRIGLFDGMTPEQVQRIVDAGQVIECRAGQRIVSTAQGARTVLVVLDGQVSVTRGGVVMGRIGPGEPFGEIAFLLGAKRSADVVAESERVEVIALSDRVLQRLIESRSDLAALFLRNLCSSLALRLVEQGPAPVGTSTT